MGFSWGNSLFVITLFRRVITNFATGTKQGNRVTENSARQAKKAATPTWDVVLTAREPPVLVQINVLWHLATGARTVHVCFDDPEDPGIAVVQNIAGARVIRCDRAHWRRLNGRKGRPASQMRRQTLNANAVQDVTEAQWLFHIDADEFIWQDGDLGAELAELGLGQTELNLPVLERLFPEHGFGDTIFAGAFRAASDLPEAEARDVFGEFAPFMKRGQYSHGAGKSGVAVRQGLRMGVHNATVRGQNRWKRAAKHVSRRARLLHFDGLTPLHWAAKSLRYRLNPPQVRKAVLQPHRAAQIDWMADQGGTLEDVQTAHARLFALTGARQAQLEAYDLLRHVPFDPGALPAARDIDLSAAGFDAALRQTNPWIEDLLCLPK